MTAAGLRSITPARLYLSAGFAASALYFVLPWNSPVQSVAYDLIALSSAAAIVVGTRLHRPSLPVVWYLFAAGQFAFAVGDIIFNLYAWVWEIDPPIPSVADVFYLAGYPFLTVALILLVLRLRPEDRRVGLIDASLFAVAFATCQWVFVMRPLVDGSTPWVQNAVALSYPAMDVLLLAGFVFLALTPVWRVGSYRYLTAGIVLLIVVDEVYAMSPASFAGTSFLDIGWIAAYVLWGAAALSPSMRELSRPRVSHSLRLTNVRLIVLTAAVATAPVVLVVEHALGRKIHALEIAAGAAILSGLVLVRFSGLVRALETHRRAEQAARAEAETAHRQLAEQNEQLREADRLKDEFVALISHDLRTPLTSIMGYVELTLDEESLTETQRAYLEVVNRNADRLLHLVNDLLFVARLEAGQLDLQPGALDLAAVVRQCVAEAEPRAAARKIAIRCDADSAATVLADRGRMFQLLDNLVSNAIKFTPEGGDVRVSVVPINGVVRLEVADTGIGIPLDEQERLFQRFFRASGAEAGQIPGTGLGLYIARAIVEAHGGSISVRSEPGTGTAFQVEMPAEHAGAAL